MNFYHFITVREYKLKKWLRSWQTSVLKDG